ncbi:hypothetical protein BFP70_14175 [Thioclava sp. SK-1]|uniref:hypothetical protein n=1 Tax=Thioclava sp. SK-1 TaxID=1889770 RepID=UPI0008245222|nr:hypothetical protein [Thioclava sp. SK-1]OCX62311.1 hypothetical protein BFP70_14175 [Thioclava sp. SK-1]
MSKRFFGSSASLYVALGIWPISAFAQPASQPLTAIDWLSNSVVTPAAMAPARPPLAEPPISAGVSTEIISATSLDGPNPNALGLIAPSRSGLPMTLWGDTPEPELAQLLRREQIDALPAIRALMQELLLAELNPPVVTAPGAAGQLFLARIDRLLDLGDLEPALELLNQANATDPEIFRRRFDVALLLGAEDSACAAMEDTLNVAPTLAARIFCLARRGDWEAAALSLSNGEALAEIDPETSDLMAYFLDPELTDINGDLPVPSRVTPLSFRMMEAIGQPLPTSNLPVAFAHADLRDTSGWKARLEAAERLTRLGALDPNQLLGLYTERRAAASGGVWDRVAAVTRLDVAISRGDASAVALSLPNAYAELETIELEPALAALYAVPLSQMRLPHDAKSLAFRMGLLTPDYETIARAHQPIDATERLLQAIAAGNTKTIPAQDQLGLALKQVFDQPPNTAPPAYAPLLPDQFGAAILHAMQDVTEGAKGDYRRMVSGLRLLRVAGLESTARRTALEMMILERRG